VRARAADKLGISEGVVFMAVRIILSESERRVIYI
jgi:hypothetical protein